MDMAELAHPAPQRIARALDLMVRHGMDCGPVTEKLMAEFTICKRTADEDYAKAKQVLVNRINESVDEKRARIEEALWRQYDKADGTNQVKNAVAAQRALISLLPQRYEETPPVLPDYGKLTPEQRQELRELIARKREILARAGA